MRSGEGRGPPRPCCSGMHSRHMLPDASRPAHRALNAPHGAAFEARHITTELEQSPCSAAPRRLSKMRSLPSARAHLPVVTRMNLAPRRRARRRKRAARASLWVLPSRTMLALIDAVTLASRGLRRRSSGSSFIAGFEVAVRVTASTPVNASNGATERVSWAYGVRCSSKIVGPDESCVNSSGTSTAKTYCGPMGYGRSAQPQTWRK